MKIKGIAFINIFAIFVLLSLPASKVYADGLAQYNQQINQMRSYWQNLLLDDQPFCATI